MLQFGVNKSYKKGNQNLSNLDAEYYLSKTSRIALVLLMLNSMLKFLKLPVRYLGCAGLHSALTIAFSLACRFFGLLVSLLMF